jgi:hypothetical protein
MLCSRNGKVTIAGFGVEFTFFCRDGAIPGLPGEPLTAINLSLRETLTGNRHS